MCNGRNSHNPLAIGPGPHIIIIITLITFIITVVITVIITVITFIICHQDGGG